MRHFQPDDPLGSAMLFVQEVINSHIGGKVAPSLIWDEQCTRLEFRAIPNNLLGMLWLQAAENITQRKKYRQCQQCAKWFELVPKVEKKGKDHCSSACRSKAYRKRQLKARQLHAEGESLHRIARDLRTELETVRGWLTNMRRE
jgi:hypothetical protein